MLAKKSLFSSPVGLVAISVQHSLQYRINLCVKIVLTAFPFFIQLFIWNAIHMSSDNRLIGGYSKIDITLYVLCCIYCWVCTNFEELGMKLSEAQQSGLIRHFLIKPMNVFKYFFFMSIGTKLLISLCMLPILLIVVIWIGTGTVVDWIIKILSAHVFIFMGMYIGYLLNCIAGISSVWFINASGLIIIINLLSLFLGGGIIPLDLLPDRILSIVSALPFKYMMFYPSLLMIGRKTESLLAGFLLGIVWIIVMRMMRDLLWLKAQQMIQAEGA